MRARPDAPVHGNEKKSELASFRDAFHAIGALPPSKALAITEYMSQYDFQSEGP